MASNDSLSGGIGLNYACVKTPVVLCRECINPCGAWSFVVCFSLSADTGQARRTMRFYRVYDAQLSATRPTLLVVSEKDQLVFPRPRLLPGTNFDRVAPIYLVHNLLKLLNETKLVESRNDLFQLEGISRLAGFARPCRGPDVASAY